MRVEIVRATPARHSRVSLVRAIGATLGLGVAGASVGAGLGAGLAVTLSPAFGCLECYPLFWDPWLGGFAGAVIGTIALPAAAWSLPLVGIGRIIATTAVGTLIGAATWFFWINHNEFAALLGAVVGFVFGASYLGIRSSTTLWGPRR